jgi:hypothetical protein
MSEIDFSLSHSFEWDRIKNISLPFKLILFHQKNLSGVRNNLYYWNNGVVNGNEW